MIIKDKVAVVTGGNSGIGYAIVEALAREGAHVVIGARRQSQNQHAAEAISAKHGVKTLALQTDTSREADCERLIEQAVASFGEIDFLVNNAGTRGGDEIARTATGTFDSVIKTNLYGTFWCSRAAYRQMQRNRPVGDEPKGAILNIASIAGKEAWSGTGTYSASKFGIMALTQAMADEGKAEPIKVAAICPALVATPMTGVSGSEFLQPEDCAATVLYLLRLSPAAWPTEVVLPRQGAE